MNKRFKKMRGKNGRRVVGGGGIGRGHVGRRVEGLGTCIIIVLQLSQLFLISFYSQLLFLEFLLHFFVLFMLEGAFLHQLDSPRKVLFQLGRRGNSSLDPNVLFLGLQNGLLPLLHGEGEIGKKLAIDFKDKKLVVRFSTFAESERKDRSLPFSIFLARL